MGILPVFSRWRQVSIFADRICISKAVECLGNRAEFAAAGFVWRVTRQGIGVGVSPGGPC